MTNEELSIKVKKWMNKKGYNNKWLANAMLVKVTTVNSWFTTRGFPKSKIREVLSIIDKEGGL